MRYIDKNSTIEHTHQKHPIIGYVALIGRQDKYPSDRLSVTMSDEPSVLELTARSERGDPEAQYLLGKRYYGGEGVESDLQKAVILISSAADAGFPVRS